MATRPSPWARAPLQVALDIGTEHTRLAVLGDDVVVQRPTAARRGEAEVAPLRDGAIVDYDALELLLTDLLTRHAPAGRWRPRQAIVAVGAGATEVERRALVGSLRAVGLRDVSLVPTALAAAVGAGLPADAPRGLLVVHVGATRTDVAVLCAGAVVAGRSPGVGGQEADRRIIAWIRAHAELLVPREVAVALKQRAASAPGPHAIQGHVLGSGEARRVEVPAAAVQSAVLPVTTTLRDAVVAVLRELPPELCADLLDSGVVLTGGGASVPGLPDALRAATGLPVLVVDQPEDRVIQGLIAIWTRPAWVQRLGLPS